MKFGKLLTLLYLSFLFLPAEGSDKSIQDFLNSSGKFIYALAWPTATYKRTEFLGITTSGYYRIGKLRLHGLSAFSDGPLWVDVEVVFHNGSLKDIRWGSHNALLAPPGATVKAMGEIIEEMAAEYERNNASRQFNPSTASPQKWALTAVYNQTKFTIPVNRRWGEAGWEQTKLAPGEYCWAWYPYPEGTQRSPDFQIAYDWTINDNTYVGKTYILERFASTVKHVDNAKQYIFVQSGIHIIVREK